MLRISPKYYDPEASGLTSWRIETESIPRPPQVIASSFTQSPPYLHNYPFGILLGVTMMCLLTQVIMPLYGSCSSVPSFVVLLPSVLTSRLATLQLTNGSSRYTCP